MTDGAAHSLGRHPGTVHPGSGLLCQCLIGTGFAIGYFQQKLPYKLTKFGSMRAQRRQKTGIPALKIEVQPACGHPEDRRLRIRKWLGSQGRCMGLSLKPESRQRIHV